MGVCCSSNINLPQEDERPITRTPPQTENERPITRTPPRTEDERPITRTPPRTEDERPITRTPPRTATDTVSVKDPVSVRVLSFRLPSRALTERGVSVGPPSVELSSDSVYIEIDTGEDENRIDAVEKGCPDPSPPDNRSYKLRPTNHWFEDDSFQNASDEVKDHLRQIEAVRDNDNTGSDIVLAVKNAALGHRAPQPITKKTPKLSFYEIDAHARRASNKLLNSFEALIAYLKIPIPLDDKNKELLTARAIIVWLSRQNTAAVNCRTSLMTPRGLLRYLKEGKMTYATCYTILCRAAKLHCTLINGLVKAADYQPGDREAPCCPWTAVYADRSWHLVHPFWMCKALYGHQIGEWVKIEADGQNVHGRDISRRGIVQNTFQEWFFMPRPIEFIHMCYATDAPWQLLTPKASLKSDQYFFDLPYLLPPFFDLGLELMSEKNCVLESKDGRCKIELKAWSANAHMLELPYELFVKEKTDEYNILENDSLSRMVFNSRSNEYFVFDIRFPTEGIFKFVIYGRPHQSNALRACEFKLICKKRMQSFKYLPLVCDKIGWGPSPVTANEGLILSSKPNGLIAIPKTGQNKTINIRFQIKDELLAIKEYTARLFGEIGGKVKTFEKYINSETNTRTKTLIIYLDVSSLKGEYGVTVSSKDRSDIGFGLSETKTDTGSHESNGQYNTGFRYNQKRSSLTNNRVNSNSKSNKSVSSFGARHSLADSTNKSHHTRQKSNSGSRLTCGKIDPGLNIHNENIDIVSTNSKNDNESDNVNLKFDEASSSPIASSIVSENYFDDSAETIICNYLLSTNAYKKEKPNIRLSKKWLNKALESDKPLPKKIEEINACIADCKNETGPEWMEHDDIRAAQDRLEFLVYKNSLREALLRRNLGVTRRTLMLVNNYRHKEGLVSEITKGEQLEQELVDLHGHLRGVPTLKKAFQEIVTIPRVPENVISTFKELCLVLGEPEINTDHRFNVQSVLRQSTQEQKDKLFSRMKRIEHQTIDEDQRDEVLPLLESFSQEDVRKSNTAE